MSTDDDWSTLAKPFHVRCYEILRSRDFDSAVSVVTSETRACSTNFLIAQTPDKVVDIEAAPDKLRLLGCEGGCLVHTNNFTDPEEIGVTEPIEPEARVFQGPPLPDRASCYRSSTTRSASPIIQVRLAGPPRATPTASAATRRSA